MRSRQEEKFKSHDNLKMVAVTTSTDKNAAQSHDFIGNGYQVVVWSYIGLDLLN